MMFGTISAAAAVVVLASGIAPAVAQTWPVKPITIVVPLAPGGGPDALARIFAPHLTELLGRQVVVENVPGAGGMTGSARVAKAPPDGYQIVIGNLGTHAQNQTLYKAPLYNSATDFAPIGLVGDLPLVLIARPNLPASNFQEFVAWAKANSGSLQFGSAGAGSAAHLGCVLLNAAIGVTATHVPYRSGASSFGMQDMIAGRIDYMCPTLPLALSQIESKTIKAIAIMSRERSPRVPWLASAHEQGLANFEASAWNAFFTTKGTPPEVVRKLNEASVATMSMPAVQSRLQEIGINVIAPERRSPDYLQKFVESEIVKWAGPIKASGVTAE